MGSGAGVTFIRRPGGISGDGGTVWSFERQPTWQEEQAAITRSRRNRYSSAAFARHHAGAGEFAEHARKLRERADQMYPDRENDPRGAWEYAHTEADRARRDYADTLRDIADIDDEIQTLSDDINEAENAEAAGRTLTDYEKGEQQGNRVRLQQLIDEHEKLTALANEQPEYARQQSIIAQVILESGLTGSLKCSWAARAYC